MNTSCIRFLILVILSVNFLSHGQDDLEMLHENAFSIRHSFSKNYNANFELSSRAFTYMDEAFIYTLQQLQISHFSTLKLDLKQSLALGVLYRNREAFEDSSNEVRLTQQYNFKTISRTFRLGHRFRSEQRFYNDFTAFRFRYRFAIDVPLQGLKLDVGETYFILTNEGLLTTTKRDKPEIGYRISPSIGLQASNDLTIEFGVELRLSELNIETKESIFFNTSVDLRL